MSRLMFVYLTGSEKGKTRIFPQKQVTIGTSDSCDLKLVPDEGGSLPEGVLAEVYDDDGVFHLMPREGVDGVKIDVNGDELKEVDSPAGYVLHDGDTVNFGNGGPSASVLFQVMPENFSSAQLVRRTPDQIERAAGQPVHPLTATLFVKELTASLWAEIPRKARLTAMTITIVVVASLLGTVLFGFIMLNRNYNETERVREQMSVEQQQREQYQGLIKRQQEEIDRLREISDQMRQFTQRIAERYSPGVCLIVGSYSFAERGSGRLLRYETSDDANEPPIDPGGNLLASAEGAGPVVRFDYTGTGFLIDDGVIATNKHVVRPWDSDQVAQIILSQGGGFRPRLDTLVAFFPSHQSPFKLRAMRPSDSYDVALCSFDQGDAALPVLTLSTQDPAGITIGQPVVLLGFPTGVDGLLQRIDESERREILKQHGQSAEDVATGLAQSGLIRPLTTTGTVSDALPGRIVHSAQTTDGGSGSPIFDRDGLVIAINSAILTTVDGSQTFGGSNFGVPIKTAFEMLSELKKNSASR